MILRYLFVVLMLLTSYQAKAFDDFDGLTSVILQLDTQHQFSHAGFYIAKNQGYYQEQGLDVIIKEGAQENFSPLKSLETNSAQFAVAGSSLISHLEESPQLRVLATVEQFSPWVLLTNPNITIESLKHQSIAISHQASEIHTMLQTAGLDRNEYKTIESNDISLFNKNDVAAIAVKITQLPHISTNFTKPYELINSRSLGLNFYGANIIATQPYLSQYPHQAAKFKSATIKGWQYALKHPQFTAELIKSNYKNDLSINSLLVELRQLTYLMQPNLLEIGVSSPMRWQKIIASMGLSNSTINPNNIVFEPSQTGYILSHPAVWFFVCVLLVFVFIPVIVLWHSKRRATKEMRLMNSILKTQQQASIDGILTFNAQGKLVSANNQLKQLWDLNDTQLVDIDNWHVLYAMTKKVSNPKEFLSSVRAHNADNNMQSFSEIQLRDGRTFERFSAPLFDEHKTFVGRFWSFRDITQRKLAEENIWLQANFDSLTDLPNRLMFKERLIFEVKKTARSGKQVALLFLDLDRFKEINDSMGHDVGDQLLIEVATRLKKCVRDIDMVARLGGDEFTIILSDLDDITVIDRIAHSILAALATPFLLNGQPHYISTSIGVTFSPSDGVDDVQLLKNADQAMYHAKELGRNNVQYFTQELQSNATKRLALSNDLRQAIERQQLYLEYQPIVCLTSNKIMKAEALLRWNHPELGIVPPNEFIELAEESGLINIIGEWVFEQAAKQVKILQRIEPNFTISVNTSPVQYHSNTIDPKAWYRQLSQLNLQDKSIIIELTETLLIESNSDSVETLKDFRACGMPIALDDFGTGYSSMSYLNKFDIDYLKIDRSFVSNLSPKSKENALCKAIVTMANSLGMKIIAEGIETPQQQQLLSDMGCNFGQGYHLSRPIRASALVHKLTEQNSTCIV